MFAGNFAPQGWALCDGSLLAIAENDVLFALIGTTYGGDGQNTFALPDLRGRLPLGTGQLSSTGESYILGEAGGEVHHTLAKGELPSHTHLLQVSSGVGTSATPANHVPAVDSEGVCHYGSGPGSTMNTLAIASTGGSSPHNNLQPFLSINFIISLFGVFPSQ
jgi:microcystin-dependent protein